MPHLSISIVCFLLPTRSLYMICLRCLLGRFTRSFVVPGKTESRDGTCMTIISFYPAASLNVDHLKARLVQSDVWKATDPFSLEDAKQLLRDRFDTIDYSQANEDVSPFIKNSSSLGLWSADFFEQITEQMG